MFDKVRMRGTVRKFRLVASRLSLGEGGPAGQEGCHVASVSMPLEPLTLGVLFDLSQTPQLRNSLPGATIALEFFDGILSRGVRGLTLNINSWQTQNWVEHGHPCLDLLQSLMRYGLVELSGTAAHHPILPLLHPFEARRQVVLNTSIHKRLLGDQWMEVLST